MKYKEPIEIENIVILRDGGTIVFTIISADEGWPFEFENPLMVGNRLRRLWVGEKHQVENTYRFKMTPIGPNSDDEREVVEVLDRWINSNLSAAEVAELSAMDDMKPKDWDQDLIPFYRIWSVIDEIRRSR